MKGTFRSLRSYNYRLWYLGALVSNVGTWMQRIAQDWIVLRELTNENATAVGVVMALQFGPQLLLLPLTGLAADYFDRRKLLIITQLTMAVLAFGLGAVTLGGWVQLWHVYGFAFLLGCATAFDATARHTFVSELVPDVDLPNAVALNSTSFNAARMVGPAVAGFMISAVGTGWVFLFNGVSFIAVLSSLMFLRLDALHLRARQPLTRGSFASGLRYAATEPAIRSVLLMLFVFGTFGMNFPIFISKMAVSVFGMDSGGFGILTSMMATGSVLGALLSAGRERPRMATLLAGAALFALALFAGSLSPSYIAFGFTLAAAGLAAQTFTTTANAAVQLRTEPSMRGRVMAILLALSAGGTLFGAPLVGWVADRFGPRRALDVGAAAGLAAVLMGLWYLTRHRQLRLRMAGGRIRFSLDQELTH